MLRSYQAGNVAQKLWRNPHSTDLQDPNDGRDVVRPESCCDSRVHQNLGGAADWQGGERRGAKAARFALIEQSEAFQFHRACNCRCFAVVEGEPGGPVDQTFVYRRAVNANLNAFYEACRDQLLQSLGVAVTVPLSRFQFAHRIPGYNESVGQRPYDARCSP